MAYFDSAHLLKGSAGDIIRKSRVVVALFTTTSTMSRNDIHNDTKCLQTFCVVVDVVVLLNDVVELFDDSWKTSSSCWTTPVRQKKSADISCRRGCRSTVVQQRNDVVELLDDSRTTSTTTGNVCRHFLSFKCRPTA